MSLRHHAPLRFAALAVVPTMLGVLTFGRVARAQGEPPPPKEETTPKEETPKETPKPEEKPDLIPKEIDPKKDAATLEKQGDNNPAKPDATAKGTSSQVFSDDWWRHSRPVVELHGFFRTRLELFHNFSLGRIDTGTDPRLFPRPADDTWVDRSGTLHPVGPVAPGSPSGGGCGPTDDPQASPCTNKTNASGNLRFRIDPEIHISDNLRILTQIDFLDNLVMGSTPEGYANAPTRSGYTPLLAFSQTQVAPVAGINSYTNSVSVKRVWGEFVTPIGQIRFGRMPSHWGLGILANSGDRIDSDFQSTADRLLFVTGSRALDLYVAGMWDFPWSGKTSATLKTQQGQPYNVAQLDNTHQWILAVFRRTRPEIAAQKLAKGDVVINGGLYTVYRQQILANENLSNTFASSADPTYRDHLVRLGARAWIPDLWLQILTKHLRWETEAVYIYGTVENPRGVSTDQYTRENYKIRQFGIATELEYKALNDDLRLRFNSGFATGDQGVTSLTPGDDGLQARPTSDKTVSTFRFHPDYRVDLILWRNILTRVQGAYYFKPGVEYDFTKSLDGEKFGGRAEIIWSRASKFVQTPGHKEDLGVELDLTLFYQSRDGSLNDDPSKIGGFYAMLQYGVLFPLGGLGYQSQQTDQSSGVSTGRTPEISSAQIVRLFLGIAY